MLSHRLKAGGYRKGDTTVRFEAVALSKVWWCDRKGGKIVRFEAVAPSKVCWSDRKTGCQCVGSVLRVGCQRTQFLIRAYRSEGLAEWSCALSH